MKAENTSWLEIGHRIICFTYIPPPTTFSKLTTSQLIGWTPLWRFDLIIASMWLNQRLGFMTHTWKKSWFLVVITIIKPIPWVPILCWNPLLCSDWVFLSFNMFWWIHNFLCLIQKLLLTQLVFLTNFGARKQWLQVVLQQISYSFMFSGDILLHESYPSPHDFRIHFVPLAWRLGRTFPNCCQAFVGNRPSLFWIFGDHLCWFFTMIIMFMQEWFFLEYLNYMMPAFL